METYGLLQLTMVSFTHLTTKDGLNSDGVFSLYEDRKGNIWIGTDKGICIYDGNTIKPFNVTLTNTNYIDHFSQKPASDIFLNNMVEDQSGIFWFAAENGIFCYDGKLFTRLIDKPKVENPNNYDPKLVLNLLADKKGNIWFTTRTDGIFCYNGKTLLNYKPNNEDWFR
ncbi:MAG: hypothetical protein IPK35_04590 [Saprospiraceae bacterium]|jgi:ligand-binding sensor domain-containing protein|nr:hypothetical protein [Saprospiraceae bacterium]